jgi:branched-subunit amino acid aminotransferase/4-amino-4-deoxychorismate lyase
LATQEAIERGAVEAIHVDPDGMVSEGTRTNIFFVLGDSGNGGGNGEPHDRSMTTTTICTPPDNILLQGITRKVIMELIENDYPELTLSVRPISLTEVLTNAREAFLTSSTKEILPIIAIDDQPIGNGTTIGPITRRCHQLFQHYAWGYNINSNDDIYETEES